MGPSVQRLALVCALLCSSCSHSWDDFDPRLGGGGAIDAGGTATSTADGSSSAAVATSGSSVSSTAAASSSSGSGGAGASGGAGGGGQGTGGRVGGCPPDGIALVQDDFDNGVLDATWTNGSNAGIQISETGGELVIDITPDPTAEVYGDVESAVHTMTDCGIVVHVTQAPVLASGGILAVTPVSDDRLEMSTSGTDLGFMYWIGGAVTFVGFIPYDPVAHAWWRLRESAGITYWETSPDGKAFKTEASIPTPMPVQSMYVALFGDAAASSAAPDEIRFDDLNLPPP